MGGAGVIRRLIGTLTDLPTRVTEAAPSRARTVVSDGLDWLDEDWAGTDIPRGLLGGALALAVLASAYTVALYLTFRMAGFDLGQYAQAF